MFEISEIRCIVLEYISVLCILIYMYKELGCHHNKPHVHAEYDKYAISIGIEDGEVLAGNLPSSQERKAVRWVKDNKDYLLGKWADIAVSATSITTKSRMG